MAFTLWSSADYWVDTFASKRNGGWQARISQIDFCEGCIYGKQNRRSFPVGKSWRVTTSLQLVRANESLISWWESTLFAIH